MLLGLREPEGGAGMSAIARYLKIVPFSCDDCRRGYACPCQPTCATVKKYWLAAIKESKG